LDLTIEDIITKPITMEIITKNIVVVSTTNKYNELF